MQGRHAAPEERSQWRAAALAIADWLIGAGAQFCALVIFVVLVAPMAVRRRISRHPAAPAGSNR